MSVAMRESYGRALAEYGDVCDKIVVLDADLSKSTRSKSFADKFPERFFNVGIAEQNMVGVAAGLSLRGYIPFTNTFAFAAAFRSADQIRTSVCYPNLNVKIVGHTAGLSPAFDGPSHQENSDLAVMRSLPNMQVVVPADAVEAAKMVPVIANTPGPVYLRLCRNPVPDVFGQDHVFRFGINTILKEGAHISIVAMGVMVGMALEAAERLRERGIEAEVVHVSTLKPFDSATVLGSLRHTGLGITCEEHSVYGGLYSAVAESVVQDGVSAVVKPVAMMDEFAESGPYEKIMYKYGLSTDRIEQMALDLLK